jgi:hypothetical protein
MWLLHLVSLAEETMTLFLSGFKHFHGALPTGPHQWPLQTGTGKVSMIYTHILQLGGQGVPSPLDDLGI